MNRSLPSDEYCTIIIYHTIMRTQEKSNYNLCSHKNCTSNFIMIFTVPENLHIFNGNYFRATR